MRKIITKEEQAKKTKRNQLLVGIVLIVLMVLSTAGYALTNYEKTGTVKEVDYNGIRFIKESDYWVFNLNGYEFQTKYNPEEVKNISVSSKTVIDNYKNKPLYFVTETTQPDFEIYRNLNGRFILRSQNACLSDKDCIGDFPIKSCSEDNIIIIKEPSENQTERIYQNGNCVFITASYANQAMYSDAFLFKILGIK